MKPQNVMISLFLLILLTANCGGSSPKEEVVYRSTELLKQGDTLFDSKDYDEAIEQYRTAAATAIAENSNSNLTESYSQIARCYLSMNNKDEGRVWLDKAEKIAVKTEPGGWTRYLGVKGRFLWKDAIEEKGELVPEVEEAAKVFKEMYNVALKNSLHNRAIDAANMMSIVGNADDRIEWGLKGIKAAEEGGLESWLAPLWNNLGWNYDDMGRYDESLDALKKARRYHYKKGNEKAMLIADWSVAHAYRMTGQIDSALAWCTRVSIWAKDIYDEDRSPENAEWLGMAYKEMAEAALAQGNDKRALAGFQSARMYLKKAGMENWDKKGYNELLTKITKMQANSKK